MVKDKKDIILNALRHIEKDIHNQKKDTKDDKTLIDDLRFTKDDMLKRQQNIEENSRKHQDLLRVLERQLVNKEDKIKSMTRETDLLHQQITTLKKEKERYGQQASQANQKYQQSLEEIKLKHNLIQFYSYLGNFTRKTQKPKGSSNNSNNYTRLCVRTEICIPSN